MSERRGFQILQEEYDIYTSMWNEAKIVDGPQSPVTRFIRHLIEEVAKELAALRLQDRYASIGTELRFSDDYHQRKSGKRSAEPNLRTAVAARS